MNISIPQIIGGVAVVGAVVYLLEVWLPSFLGGFRADVDLEEAKKEVEGHKERVRVQQEEVNTVTAEVTAAVVKIQQESVADAVATAKHKEEVTKDAESVKDFLEGEGFNVEEIYPE